MKCRKLGRIFDPTEHLLPNNCHEYAQAPQALVFEDFVRIYFSTRERDRTGKFLSHIAFVDFDKSLRNIVGVSSQTVIELGGLGTFDEHGIFPMNVLRDGDRILGYTGGWTRRVSVPGDGSIGLAISHDDGLTFRKVGTGPVLTSSLQEPFLIGDPFIMKVGATYHMWYVYGVRWIENPASNSRERVYKIGHATSADGVAWTKTGRQLINDKLNFDECQALPTVVRLKGEYHMFFCYREAIGFRNERSRSYRIGYASSIDAVTWVRQDDASGIDVSDDGWDSFMVCYPNVFLVDGNVHLLYNGNEFGRFGFGAAVLADVAL